MTSTEKYWTRKWKIIPKRIYVFFYTQTHTNTDTDFVQRRCTWFMITSNFSLNLLIAPILLVQLLFRCVCLFFSSSAATAIFYILSHLRIVPYSFVAKMLTGLCVCVCVRVCVYACVFFRVHKNCTIRLLATIINLYSSTQFSELCEIHGERKDIHSFK